MIDRLDGWGIAGNGERGRKVGKSTTEERRPFSQTEMKRLASDVRLWEAGTQTVGI